MISAVAFCPHPPLLVPAAAAGATAETAQLRACCLDAAARLTSDPPTRVVVVGGGECPQHFGPGSTGALAGFGVSTSVRLGAGGARSIADRGEVMPLSLTIGAWLLGASVGSAPETVAVAVTSDDLVGSTDLLRSVLAEQDSALLVMGDGSARRTDKAPGYLDPRAEAFDRNVAEALAAGSPQRLRDLDAKLGGQLLAAGTAAWLCAGRVLSDQGGSWKPRLTYHDAPFGVGYLVATWTLAMPTIPAGP